MGQNTSDWLTVSPLSGSGPAPLIITGEGGDFRRESRITIATPYTRKYISVYRRDGVYYYDMILSRLSGYPGDVIYITINTNLPSTASTITVTGPGTYNSFLNTITINNSASEGDEITVTAISDYDSSYQDSSIINVSLKKNYIKFETIGSNILRLLPYYIKGEVEYSTNGINWITVDRDIAINLSFDNNTPLYLRGKNPNGFCTEGNQPLHLYGDTGVTVTGNIMSLIDYETLPNNIPGDFCFHLLFSECSQIVNVSKDFLPATGLTPYCYYQMFYECSLISAPDLPATTLTPYCYFAMFNGCKLLTTAPELPATILTERCYDNMFAKCSSLVRAPELPATTLVQGCYSQMFLGCTSLNYIKCMAIPNERYSVGWVTDVASSGTFIKNPNATWSIGTSGIPYGWTIIDA